jgi:hypothetical protein
MSLLPVGNSRCAPCQQADGTAKVSDPGDLDGAGIAVIPVKILVPV